MLAFPHSCMKASSAMLLSEKSFKAVVQDGKVKKVGIEVFGDAMKGYAGDCADSRGGEYLKSTMEEISRRIRLNQFKTIACNRAAKDNLGN